VRLRIRQHSLRVSLTPRRSPDSDAVFKSPKNHIQSHLDHLSRRRPVGFLRDLPYDEEGPCAGYWFASRGVAALPHSGDSLGNETGVEFLEDWWNMNWAETDYRYDREQGLLKKMVRDLQGEFRCARQAVLVFEELNGSLLQALIKSTQLVSRVVADKVQNLNR
jgi:hypothetical protein